MKNYILFRKENLLIVFLFLFSILINQHYGNRGLFPLDSFSHFDTGYKILLGEYPFKDYWVVSGPIIDYIQAGFFYLFGLNWQSYVFHASLFNAILSISTLIVLRNFNLNIYYCFIYSLLFSILAYPSSGTPFVDHHSAFFSLLGAYSLILGIKKQKKIYWILMPILFIFAFLSKQVPAIYVIILSIFVLATFSITKKKYYWIKYSFLSLVFSILFLFISGSIQGINLSAFLEQYILYPQSIGLQRIENLDLTFGSAIAHFKFIYIAIIPLLFFNLKKMLSGKKYFYENDFYYFLILLLFTFSMILHQLLTKNQTFIFFMIPVLFAFSHISMSLFKKDKKFLLNIILISICLFATFKYHIRFNENRKFHELNYVNFKLSYNAEAIDEKFSGLKWITPEYKDDPSNEISLINEVKSHLTNDRRPKMLMSNYSFFSIILNEKILSPSRWYRLDGTTHPQKGNKYYNDYKNLFIKLIKKNNIAVIYTIYPQTGSTLYNYIDNKCFEEKKISKVLNSYEIKTCYEIND